VRQADSSVPQTTETLSDYFRNNFQTLTDAVSPRLRTVHRGVSVSPEVVYRSVRACPPRPLDLEPGRDNPSAASDESE
jgi:hypothetical protein